MIKLPKLSRVSYKPLYIQLSEILIDYIRSKPVREGDLIPSEHELMKYYSLSRNTIRLAIDRLVHLNIATKVRGKGTFVKKNETIRQKGLLPGFYDFELSLKKQGWNVVNEIIENSQITEQPDWSQSIGDFGDEKLRLIIRVKKSENQIIALEERLLPEAVAKRFNKDHIRERSFFNLLDSYPEYEIKNIDYILKISRLDRQERQER